MNSSFDNLSALCLQVRLTTLVLQAAIITEHKVNGQTRKVERTPDGKFGTGGGSDSAAKALLEKPAVTQTREECYEILAPNAPAMAQAVKDADISGVAKEPGANLLQKAGNFIQKRMEEARTFAEEHQRALLIGTAVAAAVPVALVVSSMLGGVGIAEVGVMTLNFFKMPAKDAIALLVKKSAKPIAEAVKFLNSPLPLGVRKGLAGAILAAVGVIALADVGRSQRVEHSADDKPPEKEIPKPPHIPFEGSENEIKKALEKAGIPFDDAKRRASEIYTDAKSSDQIIKELKEYEKSPERKEKYGPTALDQVRFFDEFRQINARIKEEERKQERWGYDFERRINELVEIGESEGYDSPRFLWRANVIKSEIKYGKSLDSIDTELDYQLFMKSLQKRPTSETHKYPQMTLKGQKYLRKRFIDDGMTIKDMRKSLSSDKIAERNLEIASSVSLEFNGISQTQINPVIEVVASNPFFQENHQYYLFGDTKKEVRPNNSPVDGILNLGDATLVYKNYDSDFASFEYGALNNANVSALPVVDAVRTTIFHESGHCLERKLGIGNISAAYREDRADETPDDWKIKSNNTKSYDGNFAEDHFYTSYAGARVSEGGSEVVSTSLEALSNYEAMKNVTQIDREAILYGLSVLDMKPASNPKKEEKKK